MFEVAVAVIASICLTVRLAGLAVTEIVKLGVAASAIPLQRKPTHEMRRTTSKFRACFMVVVSPV